MFHVPELARDTTHPLLGSTSADGNNGAFLVESPEPGWRLALICSDGEGWEHVSIHAYRGHEAPPIVRGMPIRKSTLQERTPTWKEMCYIKRLCWDGEDVVVQFHPKESEYVNCHPNTLHLWRPTHATMPTPPAILVGPPTVKEPA